MWWDNTKLRYILNEREVTNDEFYDYQIKHTHENHLKRLDKKVAREKLKRKKYQIKKVRGE